MSNDKMTDTDEKIFIGKGEQPAWLTAWSCQPPWSRHRRHRNRKNRLAAVMAEGFARAGFRYSRQT